MLAHSKGKLWVSVIHALRAEVDGASYGSVLDSLILARSGKGNSLGPSHCLGTLCLLCSDVEHKVIVSDPHTILRRSAWNTLIKVDIDPNCVALPTLLHCVCVCVGGGGEGEGEGRGCEDDYIGTCSGLTLRCSGGT